MFYTWFRFMNSLVWKMWDFNFCIDMVYNWDSRTGSLSFFSMFNWLNTIEAMKQQSTTTTSSFIQKLELKFPTQNIMNEIMMIYPHFWMQLEDEGHFLAHFENTLLLRENIDLDGMLISPLLDETLLMVIVIFFQACYVCQLSCSHQSSSRL